MMNQQASHTVPGTLDPQSPHMIEFYQNLSPTSTKDEEGVFNFSEDHPGRASVSSFVSTDTYGGTDSELNMEDYNLSVAVLASEATGSNMPMVKEELRHKIQRKRRQKGLDELKVDYKEPKIDGKLRPEEEERRRRRRDSNRRAAAKCRIKKKAENDVLQDEFKVLQADRDRLLKEVKKLTQDKEELIGELRSHSLVCQHGGFDKYFDTEEDEQMEEKVVVEEATGDYQGNTELVEEDPNQALEELAKSEAFIGYLDFLNTEGSIDLTTLDVHVGKQD